MAYGYPDPGQTSNPTGGMSSGVGGSEGGGFDAFMKNNPSLGVLGAGAAVGGALLMGGNKLPYQGPLTGIAQQASSAYSAGQGYAQTLEQPLVTGKLPPQAQAQVDVAKQKADAAVKSRYANLGLTGSTMEADQLALNEQNVASMQFDIEKQMADLGLRAGQQALENLKLQDTIYSNLMKQQMAADKGLSDAIGGFAKAAGMALGGIVGGPPGAAIGGAAGGAVGQQIASDNVDY